MKRVLIAVLLLLLALGQTYAFEMEEHEIEAGDIEFGGSFSLSKSMQSGSDPVWNIFGSAGYFVSPKFEASLTASLSGANDNYTGTIGGGMDFHFISEGYYMPYCGGGLGLALSKFDDETETDFVFDIHAGVKNFLSEKVAINTRLGYSATFDEMDEGTLQATIGIITFL